MTVAPEPANLEAPLQERSARDRPPAIGDCIRRAWLLLKGDFGLLVGATTLAWLLMGAGSAAPYAGPIVGVLVDGPLLGGLYLLFLRRIRGEEAAIPTLFEGFERAFGQLVLGHLVPIVLALLALAPPLLPVFVWLVVLEGSRNVPTALLAGLGLLLAAGVALMTYLMVAWILTLPLIADRRLPFWQAMALSRRVVGRHWWSWFGLLLVSGLIGASGLLLCCVGVLFTAPIGHAALLCAYADVWSRPSHRRDDVQIRGSQ